jgi:hypothetical protein
MQPSQVDQADALRLVLGDFQLSLMETERNREVARQIERADERSHHRVRDDQLAQMTAFNGKMIQDMANRPQVLPAEIAPQMVSTVNIQNVTPTSFVTNLQANLYQSTHNLHQNTLNFINNTSNRVIQMGRDAEEIFQPVMNGGAPPPPPRGGERIAIKDRAGPYGPEVSTPGASGSGSTPFPGGNQIIPIPIVPGPPKAIKDKPIVIKKPSVIKPPRPNAIPPKKVPPPPMILDAPRRVKPQKNRELLEILDAFGDDPPSKRPKTSSSALAVREPLAVRMRNRLRIQPA